MSYNIENNLNKIFSGNTNFLLNFCCIKEKLIELTNEVKNRIRNTCILYTEHIENKYWSNVEVCTSNKRFCIDYLHFLEAFVYHKYYRKVVINVRMWFFAALDIPRAIRCMKLNTFKAFIEELFNHYEKCLKTNGDVVGIEAAQSCSERFTQSALNSVDWKTRMVIQWTSIYDAPPVPVESEVGKLIDALIEERQDEVEIQSDGVTCYLPLKPGEASALSTDEYGNMKWTSLLAVTRHPPINKDGSNDLLEIVVKTGQRVIVTKGKSLLVEQNGKLVEIDGDKVSVGDRIPIVSYLPSRNINDTVQLRNYLSPRKYIYTTNLKQQNNNYILPFTTTQELGSFVENKKWSLHIPGFIIYHNENISKSFMFECKMVDKLSLTYNFGLLVGTYLINGRCFNNGDVGLRFRKIKHYLGVVQFLCDNDIKYFAKSATEIVITNHIFNDFIVKVCGVKPTKKTLPTFSYTAPLEFVSALVMSCLPSKLSKMIYVKSRALADSLTLLIKRFDVLTTIQHDKMKDTFVISLKPKKGFRMFKKKNKKMNNISLERIISISTVSSSKSMVYDLTVDETKNMTTVGGICVRDTFHNAGAKKSALVGIKRIEEILDAYKRISLPIVGPINSKYDVSKLVYRKLEDFCVETGIKYDLDTVGELNRSNFILYFKLKKAEYWNDIIQSVHISDLLKKEMLFKKDESLIYMFLPKSTTFERPVCSKMAEYLENSNKVDKNSNIFYIHDLMCRKHVSGIENCVEYDDEDNLLLFDSKCKLVKSKVKKMTNHTNNSKESRRTVYTPTPVFDEILRVCPDVDCSKVISNDIYWIYSTLGIAACEEYLTREIKSVLGAEGININIQHYMLITANMTCTGEIRANKYSGLKNNGNVILKATFQQGTETLAKAAASCTVDRINDISSRILLGKIANIGTFSTDMIYEDYSKQVAELEEPLNSPEYYQIEEYDNEEIQNQDEVEYIPASPVDISQDEEIIVPEIYI